MSHKTIYCPEPPFYAIGGTVASCLTQDLPPEEPARVLSLGCGDPRSILFSVQCAKMDFDYDFTCCDIEPGVLARNVILLALISEGNKSEARSEKLWNIFYHIKLDRESLSALLDQCERLVSVSVDISSWNNSRYGSFMRMCDKRTLSKLRAQWQTYIKNAKLVGREKKEYDEKFTKALNGTIPKVPKHDISSTLASGPLTMEAVESTQSLLRHYWTKGTYSMDPKVIATATIPNPTLSHSFSGKALALYYRSDPLLSIHTGPAFCGLKSEPKVYKKKVEPSHVVKVARREFFEWVKSFKDALTNKKNKLTIRFFNGDAMSFCKALNYCRVQKSTDTGYYAAPWTTSLLRLDGGDYSEDSENKAPVMFNAIDTSNLADNLGLINLLLMTTPLLIRSPLSCVYSETKFRPGDTPINALSDRICGDIPAVSLLFDLAPISYLMHVNSRSSTHAVLLTLVGDPKGGCDGTFGERITWKLASLSDPLSVKVDGIQTKILEYESTQLAHFVFGIYQKMFKPDEHMRDIDLIHYTRGTLVLLLKLVKDRVKTDWDDFMKQFNEMVVGDTNLSLGKSNYQELAAQLHVMGLHTFDFLGNYRQAHPDAQANVGVFKDWKDVPPVVCVVLTVSRGALRPLIETGGGAGNPFLHCETWNRGGQNYYSCFHPVFGKVRREGDKVVIDEAPDGWRGTSPLVVSFWVPSWTLITHPNDTIVAFGAMPMSPRTTGALALLLRLGQMMRLSETNLISKNVIVTRTRPYLHSEMDKVRTLSFERDTFVPSPLRSVEISPVRVKLDESCQKIVNLTIRGDLLVKIAKDKLSSGAEVTVVQSSPCTLQVQFGGLRQTMAFPFPVDVAQAKTKIARTSSYIEVSVPACYPLTPGGFSHKKFPVNLINGRPANWNIHYLNLDILPQLDLRSPPALFWITNHLSMMFSDRESIIRQKDEHAGEDWVVDIKESIEHLLGQYAGVYGTSRQMILGLKSPIGKVLVLIFPTDLRLDLGSHTLVMDACVLPITPASELAVEVALRNMSHSGISAMATSTDEVTAWCDLLPAFVERCRNWEHRDDCTFKRGGIPLTKDFHRSPLCSCAPGNPSVDFLGKREWRGLAPYVTRAAISPIQPVSYLEPVGYERIKALKGMYAEITQEEEAEKARRAKEAEEEKERLEKEMAGKCRVCGKTENLMRCGRCKKVEYCSGTCQKADWKEHKVGCKS